jgi:hypothetical protein
MVIKCFTSWLSCLLRLTKWSNYLVTLWTFIHRKCLECLDFLKWWKDKFPMQTGLSSCRFSSWYKVVLMKILNPVRAEKMIFSCSSFLGMHSLLNCFWQNCRTQLEPKCWPLRCNPGVLNVILFLQQNTMAIMSEFCLNNFRHNLNNFIMIFDKKNSEMNIKVQPWKSKIQKQLKDNSIYSKASRYTALRSTDLGDTRCLIGSQNTWDTRILAESLEDTLMPVNFIEYKVFQFLWLDYIVSQVVNFSVEL